MALRPERRAIVEKRRSRPPRPAVSGLERTPGNAVAEFAQLLGLAKPSGNQSRCSRHKMRRRGARPTRCTWTYTTGVISQYRIGMEWSAENVKHKADVIQTQTPI